MRVGSATGRSRPGGGDDLGHRERQLAQALVARRGHLEDPEPALLEVRQDDVGELAAVGHVDLVERDQAGPVLEAAVPASSFSMTSRSDSGSRPGSIVAVSITCTSAAQRSTWRRKSWPRPRPSLAPSIRPGTSATVKVVSPAVTTPRLGTSVVNG